MLYTCTVLRFPPSLKESDGQGRSPHPVDFAEWSALWRRAGPISPLRLHCGNLPPEKNAFPLCSPKAVEIHPNPFPSVSPPNHADSHTALFPVARKGVLSRRRPIGCFKRPKGLCANGGSPFPAPVHTAFLWGGQRPSPQHRPAILRREAAFKHVLLYFLQFSPDCALFLAICLQFFDKIAMIWVSEHIDRSEEKSL